MNGKHVGLWALLVTVVGASAVRAEDPPAVPGESFVKPIQYAGSGAIPLGAPPVEPAPVPQFRVWPVADASWQVTPVRPELIDGVPLITQRDPAVVGTLGSGSDSVTPVAEPTPLLVSVTVKPIVVPVGTACE